MLVVGYSALSSSTYNNCFMFSWNQNGLNMHQRQTSKILVCIDMYVCWTTRVRGGKNKYEYYSAANIVFSQTYTLICTYICKYICMSIYEFIAANKFRPGNLYILFHIFYYMVCIQTYIHIYACNHSILSVTRSNDLFAAIRISHTAYHTEWNILLQVLKDICTYIHTHILVRWLIKHGNVLQLYP